MKYTIRINQLALAFTKLDLKDAAILDYLISFCAADDKNIKQLSFSEGGKDYRYTWINYNYLIEEMPLLRLKGKASISERVENISKEGYIKTFHAPDQNLYIRLTEKIKELEFNPTVRHPYQRRSNVGTGVVEPPNSTSNVLINKEVNTHPENDGEQILIPGGSTPVVTDIQRTVSFFIKNCIELKGFTPRIAWNIEGPMISRFLKEYKIEELRGELNWFLDSKESEELGCTIKIALSNYVFNKWLAQRNL